VQMKDVSRRCVGHVRYRAALSRWAPVTKPQEGGCPVLDGPSLLN
jgi:hypothetical protein